MKQYSYQYSSLQEKYGAFTYPCVRVLIAGSDFAENKGELVLSDLEVELSCGYEASIVTFTCYNCYNIENEKYNFDSFKKYVYLGSDVSVLLGYGNEVTEVFRGFISQVRFVSTQGDPHHIEVMCMDIKGMMMANCYAKQMTSSSYGEAIKEIFNKPAYQKMLSMGIYTALKVTDTPDKASGQDSKATSDSIEMVSESDYEFIVKAAKRFNYEFYIDVGTIVYRRAKETAADCIIRISPKEGLLNYEIGYDITGLVKSVEVRAVNAGNGKLVLADQKLSNTISKGNKAKSLIAQSRKVYVDAGSKTKEQAQLRANTLMEDLSYRFGSIECECVGMPELKPGEYLDIAGLGIPADNRFYITNVKHSVSDERGYQIHLTGKAATLQK